MRRRNKFFISAGQAPSEEFAYGSDVKIKGGASDACALCLQDSVLQLSHIVPKWMYKWVKAEGAVLGNYPSLGFSTVEQDGLKLYMLCAKCEQFLGEAERYAANIMSPDGSLPKSVRIEQGKVYGLDVELIQRFILGLLLKVHHAEAPPFHDDSLDLNTYLRVRRRLIEGGFHDGEFPIAAMRWKSEINPGIDPKAIVVAELFESDDKERVFELLGGGWSWQMFLGGPGPCNVEFFNRRLCNESPLFLPTADIIYHRYLNVPKPRSRKERRAMTKIYRKP